MNRPFLSSPEIESMNIDNYDDHGSSGTMTKILSLYLFSGWLWASRYHQGTPGCRGHPIPGKGWPLSPCPPPGKPLCLRSHPQCCHAGLTFSTPQVSHMWLKSLWDFLVEQWKHADWADHTIYDVPNPIMWRCCLSSMLQAWAHRNINSCLVLTSNCINKAQWHMFTVLASEEQAKHPLIGNTLKWSAKVALQQHAMSLDVIRS